MRKILISALFLAGFNIAFSQSEERNPDLETWYHKDFSVTNIYGVNTEKAYKFLESKGLKPKKVIVGVLDSGVEVDHPGLIKNLWKNTKEISGNGKDDDNNGYVDDIYGWNFMGNATGNVDVDNMEVTRIVKKYRPIFEGTSSAQNISNKKKMPEEFAMYVKSKKIFNEKGVEARQSVLIFGKIKDITPVMVSLLKGNNLTAEYIASQKPTNQDEALALDFLSRVAQDPQIRGKSPQEVQKYLDKMTKEALDHYTPAQKQYSLDFDTRAELVGDDYENYNEKSYGNNDYEGPDAQHGTHVAGIIAGQPQGQEVQYGIAHKIAQIMSVRAVPNGDERDKDVANAIRYAVDNGAKVINMSFGKPVSPGKKYVWEAIKYADSKGVLLVKAAGNENEDIEKNEYFPTNFHSTSDEKPFVKNMIVVGASTNQNTALKADFSNYNKKMVDVFAPGDKIYSTVPDAKYEYLQGTSMASPVVAGAATMLLGYMPNLTPEEIIEALVKTANTSNSDTYLSDPDNKTFNMISRAGGVIDLEKAAQYAYNNFYLNSTKKSKTKK